MRERMIKKNKNVIQNEEKKRLLDLDSIANNGNDTIQRLSAGKSTSMKMTA